MISRTKPEFWELYRALPAEIQTAARNTYEKFLQNAAHPSLQLERLRSDPRAWSVRSHETFERSRCALAMYGSGFGLAAIENSSGGFRIDWCGSMSRVQRSDLRGSAPAAFLHVDRVASRDAKRQGDLGRSCVAPLGGDNRS